MKKLFLCLLLTAPVAAHAACSATDFKVENFQVTPAAASRMSMKGELVNNCAEAAAAQIQIQAKDAGGRVIQSKKGWPAGTTNIAPGKAADFNLGRMFRYDPSMQTYTVSVVSVRSW